MAHHDTQTELGLSTFVKPAQRTSTAALTTIDTLSFLTVELAALIGAVTTADASNYFAITLQHGDASDASDMVDCSVEDCIINGIPGWSTTAPTFPRINATGLANTIQRITYTPKSKRKRYVRLRLVETGTADMEIGQIVLSKPKKTA